MDIDRDLLVVIRSNGIGSGEPDLGERLMGAFLATLAESGKAPARMVFLNSGIFLTTEGSPHIAAIERLASAGTDVRSCLTCLEYFGRKDKLRVGAVGTMRDTVAAIHEAQKVVSL